MGKDEGHMGRRPAVGLIQRGAQLSEPNVFRMALRETRAGNSHCGDGMCSDSYASCASMSHVRRSFRLLAAPAPSIRPSNDTAALRFAGCYLGAGIDVQARAFPYS